VPDGRKKTAETQRERGGGCRDGRRAYNRAVTKPYDAATKSLIERHPADWLRVLGMPTGTVEVIDADLATVTTEADRVLRVTDVETPYLAHI
jgi:hypothetical protein